MYSTNPLISQLRMFKLIPFFTQRSAVPAILRHHQKKIYCARLLTRALNTIMLNMLAHRPFWANEQPKCQCRNGELQSAKGKRSTAELLTSIREAICSRIVGPVLNCRIICYRTYRPPSRFYVIFICLFIFCCFRRHELNKYEMYMVVVERAEYSRSLRGH